MDPEGPGRDVGVGRQSMYLEEFWRDAVSLYRAANGTHTYAAMVAEIRATHFEHRSAYGAP